MNPYDPYSPDPGFSDPYAGFSLEHLGYLLIVGAAWLLVLVSVVVVSLVFWRHKDPTSYHRYFASPVRRVRWLVST